MADAQRPVADGAVDGRCDRRIGEVELGLVLDGLAARKGCLCLGKFGIQQIDLLDGGIERGGVANDRGLGGSDLRGGLLRRLDRGITAGGEVRIALVVLLGKGLIGAVDVDRCTGGGDGRLLDIERSLLGVDGGLGCGDVSLGLIEGRLEVAVVNAGKRLALP